MTTTHPHRGSTRSWRRLRARWTWHLRNIGPVICGAPWCDQLVTADDTWDLSHPADQPHVEGGRDEDATPWHMSCNRPDGARIAHRRRRARALAAVELTPSRDW